jgi:ABC-type nitrate/sulfonate/bicarbonate transport system substrate-binding protein
MSTKLLAVVCAVISLWVQCAGPATAADNRKAVYLKVGYASISGNRIPLWATRDMEFFARNGLDSELIFIASSSQGMPALLSGEVPIYSGSFDTAAQAAAAGADLVIIGSSEPTPYKLIVQPASRHRGPQNEGASTASAEQLTRPVGCWPSSA